MSRFQRWIAHELHVVPLVIGLGAVLVAQRAWELGRSCGTDVVDAACFADRLYAGWLAIAGVTAIVYGFRFGSRWLMAASGALLVTGMLSRAVVVFFSLVDSTDVLSSPQAHIAGTIYTLLAFSVWVVWLRVLAPASAMRRSGGR